MTRSVPVAVEGDKRRPDLPDGTPFTVIRDDGDTMVVEVDETHERFAAAATAARIGVEGAIRAGELPAITVEAVAALFETWQPGETVAVGDLRAWDGTVYEVVQAHTTQADWQPQDTPALWRDARLPADDGTPAEWQAPTGSSDAYQAGDRVTFEGAVYESLIDANVWSPTAYPAGWRRID